MARVPLAAAARLTLAGSVKAAIDAPPFTNSAMDGFAVRASDITDVPIRLTVAGLVAAGEQWPHRLKPGEALRIMTGAPLPSGADTVVRQEDTNAENSWVEILATKPKGEAVRRRGDDLRRGRVVLRRGVTLGPAELSTLAMAGLAKVPVVRRPRVALIASGSELRKPGAKLRPGEIHESSSFALAETLRAEGAEVEHLGVAPDDREETRRLIRRGLKADMLLTAGGVSVGAFDHVRDAMRRAKVEEIFWRVAQRPGKPLVFGKRGKTLVFGLPGNPVSSLVSLQMYALPALRAMMGRSDVFPPRLIFPAACPMAQPGSLRTFHRVRFTWWRDQLAVTLTREDQRSGIFSSMLNAHALTNLPPERGDVKEGDEIECFVLDPAAMVREMSH